MHKTRDWVEAALLIAKGYPLKEVEWNAKKKATFIFNSAADLDKVLNEYLKGNLEVNASTFVDAQYRIKALIHGGDKRASV